MSDKESNVFLNPPAAPPVIPPVIPQVIPPSNSPSNSSRVMEPTDEIDEIDEDVFDVDGKSLLDKNAREFGNSKPTIEEEKDDERDTKDELHDIMNRDGGKRRKRKTKKRKTKKRKTKKRKTKKRFSNKKRKTYKK